MRNEQICGKLSQKLGFPAIQIGQINEVQLFKDLFEEDPSQANYMNWKQMRQIYSDFGTQQIKNSQFYKEGVIANINALIENLKTTQKNHLKSHEQLVQKLNQQEQKLMKVKQQYNYAEKQLQVAMQQYKNQQNNKNYASVLALEMKFKLKYRDLEDANSIKQDQEFRVKEELQALKQDSMKMIDNLRGFERNKIEIFKSSIMSIIETEIEIESQIQTKFKENVQLRLCESNANFGPNKDKLSNNQIQQIMITEDDADQIIDDEEEEKEYELCSKFEEINESMTFADEEAVETTQNEKVYNLNHEKFEQEIRKSTNYIQGIKDLINYIKQMKEIYQKYQQNLDKSIEKQYETIKNFKNNEQGKQFQESKRLRLNSDNNINHINQIWNQFLVTAKENQYQYEILINKLNTFCLHLEEFLKQINQKRNNIDQKFLEKQKQFKQGIQKVQHSVAELKYIKYQLQQQQVQQQEQVQQDMMNNQSYYQQYYQQYQNVKLFIKHPSPLIKMAYNTYNGNFPTEDECRNSVKKEYKDMIISQKIQKSELVETLHQYELLRQEIVKIVNSQKLNLIQQTYDRSQQTLSQYMSFVHTIDWNLIDFNNQIIEDTEDIDVIAQEFGLSNLNNQEIAHNNECPLKDDASNISQFNLLQPKQNQNILQSQQEIDNFMKLQKVKESPDKKTLNNKNYLNLLVQDDIMQQSQQHSFILKPQKALSQGQYLSDQDIEDNKSLQMDQTFKNNTESSFWFNKALHVFYKEWKNSEVFKNLLKKELYISANKKRSSVLEEIDILDVILHGNAPEFLSVQKLDSLPQDFLYDIDLSYRGTLEVIVQTLININWNQKNYYKIPVTMKIIIRSVNGKLRVFYSNNSNRGCWYGFVGRPVVRFNLDPVLGKDNKFSIKYIPKLRKYIEDLFSKKIDKYCLPNRRPLSIPLTKKSSLEYPKKQEMKRHSSRRYSSNNLLSSFHQPEELLKFEQS